MVRAVLFDAYGTLFNIYSIVASIETIFPGHGERLAASWRDKQIEYTRLRTLCGRYADFWEVTRDALEFCCEDLKLDLAVEKRQRLMNQYAELPAYLENAAALAKMKAGGLPLGILSNGTPAMLESALKASDLKEFFQQVISIDSVRKFKTAPEAYRLGPEAFGLPAEEILFVSSNGWDVSGATWFGYHTFWLNRASRPVERLGVRPHAIGARMDRVAEYALAKAKLSPASGR